MAKDQSFEGVYAYWGPPGTGKTRTLATQANKIVARTALRDDNTGPVVVCSLTRAAAREIADPRRGITIPKWQIGTLHAHSYRMLGSPEIAETRLDEWNEREPNLSLPEEDEADTDDYMASDGLLTEDEAQGAALAAEYHLLRTRMVPRNLWSPPVQLFADAWEAWKQENGYIDFTDMIEIALRDCPAAPGRPETIIVDEAQDHGALELQLCRKWGTEAGQLILAGDPWQALYHWRGADPAFMETIPENHIKILDQSYRVPRKIQCLSMRWMEFYLSTYRELRYLPKDGVEGETVYLNAGYKDTDTTLEYVLEDYQRGKDVMICASCGYMLRDIVKALRARGIPYSNPWRTKRGDWNPLRGGRGVSMKDRIMAFLRRDSTVFSPAAEKLYERSRMWTGEELEQWASILPSRAILKHGAKKLLTRLAHDKRYEPVTMDDLKAVFIENELIILESLFDPTDQSRGGQTARLLEWYRWVVMESKKRTLEYPLAVFDECGVDGLTKTPRIYVGTIHSFKGAEADVVYLFPDLSPAGYREWESTDPVCRDAVARCFYVGMTRAREKLVLGSASSGYTVPF